MTKSTGQMRPRIPDSVRIIWWNEFRNEHGPRPGGFGFQEVWEAKWNEFLARKTQEYRDAKSG